MFVLKSLPILSFVVLSSVFGCGSDTSSSQGSGDGDGDGDGKTSGDAGAETHYHATVEDSSSDNPVSALKVYTIDNKTAKKTGKVGTTNGSGKVSLDNVPVGPDGTFGVLIAGTKGDTGDMDTYTYNLDPNAVDDQLKVVATATVPIAKLSAAFEGDPEAGPISGAVWVGTNSQDRIPAPCLTISLEGVDTPDMHGKSCTAKDVCLRYFFDQPVPDTGATFTSAENGRFYIANAPAGLQTINVWAKDKKIASSQVFVVPRKQGVTGETIAITSIYLKSDPITDCAK